MSILDRKPKKYSTSDLFWEPSAAPIDGVVGDINTMKLDPSHLGFGQDVIIDTSGVLRSRGAFKSVTTDTFSSLCALGVAQTSTGTIMPLMDSTAFLYLYGTNAVALTGFAKLTASGYTATSQALIVNTQVNIFNFAKLPNDTGAILAGQTSPPGNPGNISTFLWGGNSVTTSDTAAGTAASTVGSKAIVGVGTAWTSALINCYLFINSILVGQVAAVGSTTTLTLYKGAYTTNAAAAPAFKTTRPTFYTVYKGRITTTTTSTSVIGSNTKFVSSGPAGGGSSFLTGNVFRYSDGAYIGTISSIQNDTTLTLTGNAAIAMTNEEYYIIKTGNMLPTPGVPGNNVFNAAAVEQFADRYWYGGINANDSGVSAFVAVHVPQVFNGANSLAFTKKKDPECLDLDPSAGDVITLPTGSTSDSIRGLCATRGGLVVFRSFDTYLITGYSPETFRAIKILDDGVLNCNALKSYNEGVIWGGFRSMWYFDGTRVVDVLQNHISRFYKRTNKVLTLVDGSQPAGMSVASNHVIFSYRVVSTLTDVIWPYKNTTKNIQFITIVINMINGAVTFFTNIFCTTGFFAPALSTSIPAVPVIVARSHSLIQSNTNTFLLNGDTVFVDSSTAADNFDAVSVAPTFTSGLQIGPDVMFETIKLTLGNAARLKFWKMLMMNYSSDVSMQASIIGINDTTLDFPNRSTGTPTVVAFPVSANVGILKRVKFLIRSPQLVVRVYQTATASATSQRFKLFWYAVGGKWMRWGRSQ